MAIASALSSLALFCSVMTVINTHTQACVATSLCKGPFCYSVLSDTGKLSVLSSTTLYMVNAWNLPLTYLLFSLGAKWGVNDRDPLCRWSPAGWDVRVYFPGTLLYSPWCLQTGAWKGYLFSLSKKGWHVFPLSWSSLPGCSSGRKQLAHISILDFGEGCIEVMLSQPVSFERENSHPAKKYIILREFIYSSIWEREKECEWGEEKRKDRQIPCWVGSSIQSSIPWPWDHGLRQNQELDV